MAVFLAAESVCSRDEGRQTAKFGRGGQGVGGACPDRRKITDCLKGNHDSLSGGHGLEISRFLCHKCSALKRPAEEEAKPETVSINALLCSLILLS